MLIETLDGRMMELPDDTPDDQIASMAMQQQGQQMQQQSMGMIPGIVSALPGMMQGIQDMQPPGTTIPDLGPMGGLHPDQTIALAQMLQQDEIQRQATTEQRRLQTKQELQAEKDRQQEIRLQQMQQKNQQDLEKMRQEAAENLARTRARLDVRTADQLGTIDQTRARTEAIEEGTLGSRQQREAREEDRPLARRGLRADVAGREASVERTQQQIDQSEQMFPHQLQGLEAQTQMVLQQAEQHPERLAAEHTSLLLDNRASRLNIGQMEEEAGWRQEDRRMQQVGNMVDLWTRVTQLDLMREGLQDARRQGPYSRLQNAMSDPAWNTYPEVVKMGIMGELGVPIEDQQVILSEMVYESGIADYAAQLHMETGDLINSPDSVLNMLVGSGRIPEQVAENIKQLRSAHSGVDAQRFLDDLDNKTESSRQDFFGLLDQEPSGWTEGARRTSELRRNTQMLNMFREAGRNLSKDSQTLRALTGMDEIEATGPQGEQLYYRWNPGTLTYERLASRNTEPQQEPTTEPPQQQATPGQQTAAPPQDELPDQSQGRWRIGPGGSPAPSQDAMSETMQRLLRNSR